MDSNVLMPKNLGEVPTRSPPMGAPNRGGSKVHIGDIRPTSRYISETVRDRDILAMEG